MFREGKTPWGLQKLKKTQAGVTIVFLKYKLWSLVWKIAATVFISSAVWKCLRFTNNRNDSSNYKITQKLTFICIFFILVKQLHQELKTPRCSKGVCIFCWHSILWICLDEGEYIYALRGSRAHTSHPRVLLSSPACAFGATLMNSPAPGLYWLQSGYLQASPPPPPSSLNAFVVEQVPLQCRHTEKETVKRIGDRNE